VEFQSCSHCGQPVAARLAPDAPLLTSERVRELSREVAGDRLVHHLARPLQRSYVDTDKEWRWHYVEMLALPQAHTKEFEEVVRGRTWPKLLPISWFSGSPQRMLPIVVLVRDFRLSVYAEWRWHPEYEEEPAIRLHDQRTFRAKDLKQAWGVLSALRKILTEGAFDARQRGRRKNSTDWPPERFVPEVKAGYSKYQSAHGYGPSRKDLAHYMQLPYSTFIGYLRRDKHLVSWPPVNYS
jgi:hypothetical protein